MGMNIDLFDIRKFQAFLSSESKKSDIDIYPGVTMEKIKIGDGLFAITMDLRGKSYVEQVQQSETKDWCMIVDQSSGSTRIIYSDAAFFDLYGSDQERVKDSLPGTWILEQDYAKSITVLILHALLSQNLHNTLLSDDYLKALIADRQIHGKRIINPRAVDTILRFGSRMLDQDHIWGDSKYLFGLQNLSHIRFSFAEFVLSLQNIDRLVNILVSDCKETIRKREYLSRFWSFIRDIIEWDLTLQTMKTLIGSKEDQRQSLEMKKEILDVLPKDRQNIQIFYKNPDGTIDHECTNAYHMRLFPEEKDSECFLGIRLATPNRYGCKNGALLPLTGEEGKLVPWKQITRIKANNRIIYKNQ